MLHAFIQAGKLLHDPVHQQLPTNKPVSCTYYIVLYLLYCVVLYYIILYYITSYCVTLHHILRY